MKHCPLHHVTYVPAKFEVAKPMVKEMHAQENTFFDLDPKVNVTQNAAQCPLHHVKYAVTTSKGLGGENTLFDLGLRIKVTQNFAKYPLHHVTLVLFSYKVLELLRQKAYKELHLQENTNPVFSVLLESCLCTQNGQTFRIINHSGCKRVG